MPNKVYLVTGANSGLGLEAVRQLVLKEDTKLVYMACRSEEKANNAMDLLVSKQGVPNKDKLAFVPFDGSVSKEVYQQQIKTSQLEPLDGAIFNAGGFGHSDENKPSEPNQVLEIVQVNLLGHVHFLDALESAQKLQKGCRIIYAGSEGARGVMIMGQKAPTMPDTPEEFLQFMDGTACKKSTIETMKFYGITKGLAALYFAAWAREHPDQVVLTVSPGGTMGTAIAGQGAAGFMEKMFMGTMAPVIGFLGFMHSVETGAKRYVDAVLPSEDYKGYPSGTFVASKGYGATGPVGDMSKVYGAAGAQYGSKEKQDAMYQAMKQFR